MGRAIVREPQVFLMDEPLSSDAKLRVQTRTQIAALQRRLGTKCHARPAMTMGDRVCSRMACNSTQHFVATFIGSPSMNMIPVALR